MTDIQPIVEAQVTSSDIVQWFADPEAHPIQFFKEDPEVVQRRIESQELNASSLSELLGNETALHGEDVVGRIFQLLSCDWRPTDEALGGSMPVFGVFKIAFADGSIETLTCGARSVVRRAAIAQMRGWLPAWMTIKAIPSATKGYSPILELVAAEAPVAVPGGEPF